MAAEVNADINAEMVPEPSASFVAQDRFSLTLGSIISILLTLWLCTTLHLPAAPGRAGSLLQQDSWPIAMGIAFLVFAACGIVSVVVSSKSHYDAGVFCACVGWAALSSQMGTMRFALFDAAGPSVYLVFAVELLLLFVPISILWIILHRLMVSGALRKERLLDETEPDESLDQKMLATVSQALLMMILMMLLCQSDAKKQTLAAVVVSGFFGALGAHHFIATRPSIWYWIGPLLVGLVGYIGQYFSGDGAMIGEARGFFAPLARPLPLDYASLGVAGAMLGYWTSLRWQHARFEIDPVD